MHQENNYDYQAYPSVLSQVCEVIFCYKILEYSETYRGIFMIEIFNS